MPLRRFASAYRASRAAYRTAALFTTLALMLASASVAHAQHTQKHASRPAEAASAGTVPVLMLSDIHFEPFQDPAKLPKLRDAPIQQWGAILSASPSPTQAADFQALQSRCAVRGVDTSWPLLSSSLSHASSQSGQPLFVTVSGDLLSHAFDCRFKALAPNATAADLSAFAAKTVAFVSLELRQAFPHSPVYLALGNNDSGCADYREDRRSPFLQHVAKSFASAARTGDNEQAILREFSDEGDYSVALPAPMHHARLFVLQDLFDARAYRTCAGEPDAAAEHAQMDWLHAQLAQAARKGEHVWVMAHMPPGVDVYNTLKNSKVCGGEAPVMFLDSERLADELTHFPHIVRLAIFAHTHGDELRLLHPAGSRATGQPDAEVPVKLVASISPVNGNLPSFTVAQVDPETATLVDYTVFLGSGAAATAPFTAEYTFSKTYGLPDFSAHSLDRLLTEFLEHKSGDDPHIASYAHFVYSGDMGLHFAAIQLLWNNYACSLTENQPASYRTCVCPSTASAPE